MTVGRDDDFMALPGMEADSTATHHPEKRLSDDAAPASSKSALDALLDEYRARAKSEREKGTLFEELTRQFLLHDARFAHQFKEIYLWSEWPDRRTGDTGIDLVAIPADPSAGPVAIQCKFYALGHRIQKADIDSFLSASGKEPFGRRIVVDTSGAPWGKNAQDAIEGQQIPVSRITLADLRDSDIDWRTYSLGSTQAPKTRERKVPRDHQVRARSAVMSGFEEHDRGTMVMACGTGKTFTALTIAREFVEKEGGTARILFAVPSLALLKQTLDDWAAEADGAFTAWAVCSDTKVSSSARNDTAEESAVDLPIPATTDGQRLADSLNANNTTEGLQVVFATYQSIEVIHRAQELAGDEWRDFDLVICDEAHRTTGATLTGEDESAFTKIHSDEFIRRAKTLYMTATPRIFADKTKNTASEKDVILTSMDDQETYGPVFFRLGFGRAVKENLLTDYKVIILTVSEEEVSGQYQAIAEMGGELNLDTAAKLTGCWNALAKRKNRDSDVDYGEDRAPMRRAVAFCKNIKASKQVTEQFPDLVNGPHGLSDLSNDDASDNLQVECHHVDGTMNAAVRSREMDWLTEGAGTDEVPVCRILTNARCLSEGVDVPTLDAVLFLAPRKSQVDVIQAVGRVMRRAEGKDFGYIILPVAVPSGMSPEQALDDNKRFQVVWQVLKALRAHDERLDAAINSMELNGQGPENIIVEQVSLAKDKKHDDPLDGAAPDGDEAGAGSGADGVAQGIQGQLTLLPSDWKESVFGRIVKKVGSSLYWDDWSKDIATVADRYIHLIDRLLEDPQRQDAFQEFVDALRATLNPAVDNESAVEMLAQHILTAPLFDAMFPDHSFSKQNPVSRAMNTILNMLASHSMLENERRELDAFYKAMVERIEAVHTLSGKQEIMRTLYDRFFSQAFPRMSERLGIVFTPVEVVDFIIRSADDAMRTAFGQSLGDPGVAIIEPFAGTGTFVARLLQLGVIPPDALEHKYKNDIFANEFVLLSYYIASINIEQVYHQVRAEQGVDEGYVEFPGMTLTDTFQLHEGDGTITEDFEGLAANNERAKAEKDSAITVVVMNPPYSAGQNSANDNNQNLAYPRLDERIAATYAAQSTRANKNSLYDSYFRALRWASDRIGNRGIIAFVSNSSFVDGNSADGVRLSLQEEFSQIFIYDLKGNQRTSGDRSRREGGKIFGSGSRTGVAITVLVKDPAHSGPANIFYAEAEDYATRQDKLNQISAYASIEGISGADAFRSITPNQHGDWISSRDERFAAFQEIGDKPLKGKESTPAIFRQFSRGLATSRDAWCYNFSREAVESNMRRMIDNYNAEVDSGHNSKTATTDSTLLAWGGNLPKDLDRSIHHEFELTGLRTGHYRPFYKQSAYFSGPMNERTYQLPQIFPTYIHPNLSFVASQGEPTNIGPLMTDALPDLHLVGDSQTFPLYTWEPLSPTSGSEPDLFADLATSSESQTDGAATASSLDFSRPIGDQIPVILDGYRRVDNVTDATLASYREHYGDAGITKEDIFFYVYALLHHPEYRERYADDLKKMLPHIPRAAGFHTYASVGRELADLHVNYERVEPYPSVQEEASLHAPVDPWERYRIGERKMRFPKVGRRDKDLTRLQYNDYVTLTGIPAEAQGYSISGRSPLEWIIDRYHVKTDKASGIVNDPNDFLREQGRPDAVVDLIKRLVTVSMRTQELLATLPPLEIPEGE
ncbi:DEAD/DEAH box helicase [Actinomyces sp. oral taxon 180]|uniref:DEAD/DEAH box helicase n=1 Tax=Actinomyces sp. oral taxon 180 TaxID=651609 RepID=UPI0001F0FC74|nr:type ISP restriction/modification enzyme [Actinomyces sp. oral taxon 180]EFU60776.1 helicase [Actinomyces sp. oral taxon 180 str. F0310]